MARCVAFLALLAFTLLAASASAQVDEAGRSLLAAKPTAKKPTAKPKAKPTPKKKPTKKATVAAAKLAAKPTAKKPTAKKPTARKPTAKPKPTKKATAAKLAVKPTAKPKPKPTVKLLTGKSCSKFGVGCSICTSTTCTTCGTTYMKSGTKCVCKTGYVTVLGKGTCVVKPQPAKNTKPVVATKKPTKKPTAAPKKSVVTAPPSQKAVADPSLKAAKALSTTCKGTTVGGLKFTVLPKLYPFSSAAAACKAAGLKLSTIDAIFSGTQGAAIGNAAMATVTKCVGTSQAVWFDTSLAAPQCNAFVAVGSPSDGSPTGRKLSAAAQVLLTQEVPTGCKTALPVLCM